MDIIAKISEEIFYPLWDVWDRSKKLEFLNELTETQWKPLDVLKQQQWKKLQSVLSYSHKHIPYYRDSFDKAGVHPENITNAEDFLRIPLLSKDSIRANTDSLISDEFRKEDIVLSKTGGSTGKSLRIYCDTACEESRNAAALRSMIWAGWNPGERRAAVWGNPPAADTLKKRIRNILLDRMIFLDTMDLTEERMADFVSLWRRNRPSLMYGHSRSLYMFAQFVLTNGISDLRPGGIISTSMMLLPHERSAISAAFGCEVTDQYGCEEVGLIGCECEKHEGMHLNIDHLYVEFIREDGTPAEPGEEAAIVVTDLVNRAMPLIRYRIEDMGIPISRECSCGRGLPLMGKVTGRTADFLVKKDGGLVAGVSLVERTLTRIRGIEQMQIVQEQIDHIILRIVRDSEYDQECEKELLDEFRTVFGPEARIEINCMKKLPQSPSGKYRFSESKVQPIWAESGNP